MTDNGTVLLAAYAAAASLTPNGQSLSSTNRASVLVGPGVYDLGNLTQSIPGDTNGVTCGLLLNAPGVDIVGTANARDCVIQGTLSGTFSAVTPAYQAIVATLANDYVLKNVTIRMATGTATAGNYSAMCVYISDAATAGTATLWEDVILSPATNQIAGPHLGGTSQSWGGTFRRVSTTGAFLFGGFAGVSGVSANPCVFEDCEAGDNGFNCYGVIQGVTMRRCRRTGKISNCPGALGMDRAGNSPPTNLTESACGGTAPPQPAFGTPSYLEDCVFTVPSSSTFLSDGVVLAASAVATNCAFYNLQSTAAPQCGGTAPTCWSVNGTSSAVHAKLIACYAPNGINSVANNAGFKFSRYADEGNGADTTDDDLGTVSILAANTIASSVNTNAGGLSNNGESIAFEAFGVFAATANNKRLKVWFGGATPKTTGSLVFDSGSVAINSGNWNLRGTILRDASGTQRITCTLITDSSLLPSKTTYTALSSYANTSTQGLQITGASPTVGAANDVTLKGFFGGFQPAA